MYVLHYTPDTAATPVRILLEALNLPYRARLIDRAGGELETPAYRARHPLGKIPVLETPQGDLFETAAILLWLSDAHAPGHMAPGPVDPDRAAFLKWLFFTSTNLHPAVLEAYYPDRVAGPAATPALLPLAAARAGAALAALETAAAQGPAWLPPDRPSLLGTYVGMLVRWLAQLPDDHPGLVRAADTPALARALAACEASPAARTVATAEALGPTPFTSPLR